MGGPGISSLRNLLNIPAEASALHSRTSDYVPISGPNIHRLGFSSQPKEVRCRTPRRDRRAQVCRWRARATKKSARTPRRGRRSAGGFGGPAWVCETPARTAAPADPGRMTKRPDRSGMSVGSFSNLCPPKASRPSSRCRPTFRHPDGRLIQLGGVCIANPHPPASVIQAGHHATGPPHEEGVSREFCGQDCVFQPTTFV